MRGIGERERRFMKRQIKYSSEPIRAKVINDFLPRPKSLVLKEKKTRVTLTLTQKSLDFFKDEAKKHNASYQAMIRELVDFYVSRQSR